ncbi:hypothetical protein [Pelagimonas varians]|uniref:Uncharacterized protein n=1 Tax=Pelagimonas varians TaxID=696760 RepID=A0A238KRT9_9RHOB|nr:hypothetical protein [Pelagimonas varians]PYG28611.1 hypothetical protein C8N36_111111 [Pelagimonas varians]SMX45397.1 hypothetical protein PEV8663_03032 [Pelagimonas varians]
MDAAQIEQMFTRKDGSYLCARWGRPIVPTVFGVQDETLSIIKGAFEALCVLSGHQMAETDPELGSNVMMFFFKDWDELLGVPDLDRLIDGLGDMVGRLKAAGANQYRVFRFDDTGAIQAAFVFLRVDKALAEQPAEDLALSQVAQVFLLWSEQAFAERSPLAKLESGQIVLHPETGAVIRAAYDKIMPPVAHDPSHAMRLAARVAVDTGRA